MVGPDAGSALSVLHDLGQTIKKVDSDVLRRVFGSGQAAEPHQLVPLLGPLERYFETGLLRRTSNGQVESTLQFEFFKGLLLASDRREHPYRHDHVLGVTWSAQLATACSPGHHVESALDVGCGSGVLALHLARQADSVTATDVSPRAVAATRMNAALNGLDNVEVIKGDLFSAVTGRAFDFVAANPPYVISPETTLLYRDSPLAGDDISRETVAGAASVLAPAGLAVILVEWIDGPTRSWDRPRRWMEATGCAGWILSYANADAPTYVDQWLEVPARKADHDALRGEWLEYLRSHRAESVTSGVIVLQRQDRVEPWVHATDFVANPALDQGTQIVSGIDNQRMVALGSLGPILDRPFTLASGATVHAGVELRTNLGAVTLTELEARIVGYLTTGATLRRAIASSGSSIRAATPGMLRLIRCGAIEPVDPDR